MAPARVRMSMIRKSEYRFSKKIVLKRDYRSPAVASVRCREELMRQPPRRNSTNLATGPSWRRALLAVAVAAAALGLAAMAEAAAARNGRGAAMRPAANRAAMGVNRF